MIASADALIVVDVQRDFLPGGSLAVPSGDEVIEPLNRCLDAFAARRLPVLATRDWHPPGHCSFKESGGLWPPHCVAGTPGAEPPPELRVPDDGVAVYKASDLRRDAYSGFDGTTLEQLLYEKGVSRVVIGGLAGDYCVGATARDALRKGFAVVLLGDAIRSVDAAAGRRSLALLEGEGATLTTTDAFLSEAVHGEAIMKARGERLAPAPGETLSSIPPRPTGRP